MLPSFPVFATLMARSRQHPGRLREGPSLSKTSAASRGWSESAASPSLPSNISFIRCWPPTHLLMTGSRDAAFRLDLELSEKLRAALDVAGGESIAIDYPLILAAGVLKDAKFSEAFVRAVQNLPIENVWVRSSGFGSTVTPIAIVRYVRSLREVLQASRPIIVDGAAGLAGLAALAFGAAVGLAHGIGVHESFKASEWQNKRPTTGGGQP